jgi:hypothetical protein
VRQPLLTAADVSSIPGVCYVPESVSEANERADTDVIPTWATSDIFAVNVTFDMLDAAGTTTDGYPPAGTAGARRE